jgi:hypothetical protein
MKFMLCLPGNGSFSGELKRTSGPKLVRRVLFHSFYQLSSLIASHVELKTRCPERIQLICR